MKYILIILSIIGLVLTIAPSVLVFMNVIEFETHKHLMLAGTLIWFFTAPFWIKEKSQEAA